MKTLFLFCCLFILFSCSKEDDCPMKNCEIYLYHYRTCDGGETFTDVRIDTVRLQIDECSAQREVEQRIQNMQNNPTRMKFHEQYPTLCNCN